MPGNAEILLIRPDGSVILQVRDNKPGITNPGLATTFGGHIETGEEPIDAAVREINEETNLALTKDHLVFYCQRRKTKERHGEDWDVYFFAAPNVSDQGLEVYEGSGYKIVSSKAELAHTATSVLARELLEDYFDGFRTFMFKSDLDDHTYSEYIEAYYQEITAGKRPSTFTRPVAIAVAGLVASGKTTLATPLARKIDAVTLSSDLVREQLFRRGFNFKRTKELNFDLITRLSQHHFNLFLDFNAAANIPILDSLADRGYRVLVIHSNPPEAYIKHKILSGNMKHELTFFTKDKYVLESMERWKQDHYEGLSKLKAKYGIWFEANPSLDNTRDIQERLIAKFEQESVNQAQGRQSF